MKIKIGLKKFDIKVRKNNFIFKNEDGYFLENTKIVVPFVNCDVVFVNEDYQVLKIFRDVHHRLVFFKDNKKTHAFVLNKAMSQKLVVGSVIHVY